MECPSPDDDQTSSETETVAEPQNYETSSKDTLNPDDNVSMNTLNTYALGVNSADEIRQAIKAVLSGKVPQNPNNSDDSGTLTPFTAPQNESNSDDSGTSVPVLAADTAPRNQSSSDDSGTLTPVTAPQNESNCDDSVTSVHVLTADTAPQNQSNSDDSGILTADTSSEETRTSIPHEYKPESESGDRLVLPKNTSTRKRRGRPQKNRHAKRMKRMTEEEFYVEKLTKVANTSRLKRRPH